MEMTQTKRKTHIIIVILLMLLFVVSHAIAQINLNNTEIHESKIFAKNPIHEIQSLYLDS